MTESIEALRSRSDQLEPDDLEETIAIDEAILRLVVGDLMATRSLALALVKLGQLDRAEEVVEEALLLHPEDELLVRRADDVVRARRWAAKESAAGGTRKRSARVHVAKTWIKAVHYDSDGWTEPAGSRIWVSDPGQRDKSGGRMYTAAAEPWGRPSWRVGEHAGIYLGGTKRVPLLVEILQPPDFNAALVQAADWAEPGDGERWPWVTWVRILRTVALDDAPTLDELGIPASSMQQRARLLTDPDIHGRLVQALNAVS